MITLLLALTVMTAAAQEKKEHQFNEKLFDAKVSELVYRLDMTDEQKAKFVPVYRKYNDEMRALWGNRKRPRQPMSDEERLAHTKQRMQHQQQAQAIRLKYMDSFSSILTAKQVNKFYEEEGKMQKKFMERKHMKRQDFKNRHGQQRELRKAEFNKQEKKE